MKISTFFALVCAFLNVLKAQQSLSFHDALATLLQNNFSIQLLRQNVEIATNDVQIGNAGMLPIVNINGSYHRSTQNTKQEFVTGSLVDKTGAISTNANAGIGLEWKLFDGMKMFVSYDKLKTLKIQSEWALKHEIENQLVQLIGSYYDVTRKQQTLELTNQLLSIAEEQLKIATARFEIGSGKQQDIYQAKLNVNLRKSAKLEAEHQLRSVRKSLNQLLALDPDNMLHVDTIIPLDLTFLDSTKTESRLKNNTYIHFLEAQKSVREFEHKELNAQRFPTVSLDANYTYGRTDNQAGFLLYNQNLGWTAGLSTKWNVFNGFQLKKEIANAHIRILQSQLEIQAEILNAQIASARALDAYRTAFAYLELEKENIQLTESNLKLILESYRSGQSTSLEVQDAQKLFEESHKRFVDYEYEAKVAEAELKRQEGTLIE